ncbi:MAG: PhzF family phenazine biosynthesis protein [Phycisphaerae bacterium]
MPARLAFSLVDAFSAGPYTGNPAGVVLDAGTLNDAQMQAIAREINASETAFLARGSGAEAPRLRWFTPRCEVSFCGHATLATAHALHALDAALGDPREPAWTASFSSSAGRLVVRAEPDPADPRQLHFWLEMPPPQLSPDQTNPMRTCELLGLSIDDVDPATPIMRTRDDDLIVLVKSWHTLMGARPRFAELAEWCTQHNLRGVCAATTHTLSPSIQVHSRFFAPASGVNEDPVTGSVHGPLAMLLVINHMVPVAGARAALNCLQSEAGGRSGLVHVLVESRPDGYHATIGGRCDTVLTGTLVAPPVESPAV